MKVLVTGASGFVGSHVARKLVERGDHVRVLLRPSSSGKSLGGLPVERVEGDLCDPGSLKAAVEGCRQVYHVAADYRLWVPDPDSMYRGNVEGTRTLLTSAAEAGAERIVYTSTVGALGCRGDGTSGTEETPVSLSDMVGHYKRSKFMAEQEALKLAGQGAPVVIVNPSTPVGPGDWKPTPTGQTILDFLRGAMPAYIDTGMNLVHVDDVAQGHLLAAEHGRPGEKYILGNQNVTLRRIFELLSEVSGLPAPKVRLPYAVAYTFAWLETQVVSRLTHKPPRAPLDGVKMAKKLMYFDASKAVAELGLPQTPLIQALEDAVRWYRAQGYCPQ
ncbi:MAG TPA: hopanoid-associated sugar epimerase [Armatimonadota bacterium]